MADDIVEQFPTILNRLGFPNQASSDSNCLLAKEAGRHGNILFRSIFVGVWSPLLRAACRVERLRPTFRWACRARSAGWRSAQNRRGDAEAAGRRSTLAGDRSAGRRYPRSDCDAARQHIGGVEDNARGGWACLQHLRVVALLPTPEDHAQKKTTYAAEQERPDILKRREEWFGGRIYLDPDKLVFIDETWASTNMARTRGRAPRGERLRALIPHGHWKTTTFVAGLRLSGMVAPMVLDGPINGQAFQAYVDQVLVPELREGRYRCRGQSRQP